MDNLKKSILDDAYEHYKNTYKLDFYCKFPKLPSEKTDYIIAIEGLEIDGYLENITKSMEGAEITLTEYAINFLSEA